MKTLLALTLAALLVTQVASAEIIEKKVPYTLDGVQFEGVLVYDDDIDEPAPAVLMVPNWMGVTDASIEKAKKLADDDYVFFVADMYGVDVRPQNSSEAGKAAGTVRADRDMMRARAQKALNVLLAQEAPINKSQTAAIGFCFGGGTVLELARSGADLDAVVSFHGDLASPTLAVDSGNIQGSVLVLHGADDPFVPQSDVQAFVAAMMETDVDWQLVQFSNTVHSFTDPHANMPGKAEYNALSAKRAFAYMDELFDEKFSD
ncbi:dienelactone hydrolase family protein [Cerasicoccus fimbriatus]|uniref:dienelactone hydrolase family protein n=1 Tax=Cerasicoccus fimbriatus TaxID=3014554 RepID=UPI0022B5C01E|nr:dienelactone hydrolase family protein [Cerasicoccus sp. TK19100]